MDSNMIRGELRKLSELVEGWVASGNVPSVERDMVLGKLRTLYELVRFDSADAADAAAAVPDVEAAPETAIPEPPAAEEAVDAEREDSGEEHVEEAAIDLGEVLSLGASFDGGEPAPIQESEPQPEPVPAEEPVAAFEPAPVPEEEPAVAPEPDSEQGINTLFGPDDETTDRHRHKQRLIMSLYDTAPADRGSRSAAALSEELTNSAAEIAAEDAEPEYPESGFAAGDDSDAEAGVSDLPGLTVVAAGEAAPVLGDVIGHDRQTLADTIAPPHDIASELLRSEPVDDLHRAIGINDKFLMIRDLFDGDEAAFERAIGELNARADLDDCMIHIAENYAWNPDSDGAKLLMELLERKFA